MSSLCDCVRLPAQGTRHPDARVLMPWIGFGTYKLHNAQQAVSTALDIGYRHVETAFIYSGEKTEPEVGKALSSALESGLGREEVFVTTKHWRAYHGAHALAWSSVQDNESSERCHGGARAVALCNDLRGRNACAARGDVASDGARARHGKGHRRLAS